MQKKKKIALEMLGILKIQKLVLFFKQILPTSFEMKRKEITRKIKNKSFTNYIVYKFIIHCKSFIIVNSFTN